MTVICDKCGKSYFVAGVVSRSGELAEPSCLHCGQPLWSNEPARPQPRRDLDPPVWKPRSRGFS